MSWGYGYDFHVPQISAEFWMRNSTKKSAVDEKNWTHIARRQVEGVVRCHRIASVVGWLSGILLSRCPVRKRSGVVFTSARWSLSVHLYVWIIDNQSKIKSVKNVWSWDRKPEKNITNKDDQISYSYLSKRCRGGREHGLRFLLGRPMFWSLRSPDIMRFISLGFVIP